MRGQITKGFDDKFRQLEEVLPTPNNYRTGSGAPGHQYWQQQADYKITAELNDEKQAMTCEETITYTNNSPDALSYVWLQLDQNNHDPKGIATQVDQSRIEERMTARQLEAITPKDDYGFKIDAVTDATNKAMRYTIVETMMRVDLAQPLKKGEKLVFKVKWHFNIVDRLKTNSRGGWEYFPEENNYLYTVAQWFPRLCVYSDVTGWQHKQFLGSGEFTLNFGDYEVALTVPADHIVGATGLLQNADKVLTTNQLARYNKAKTTFDNPVIVVTEAEAREAEKIKATAKKTWIFKATNVRDFAFCSSRKFIWDAMAVKQTDGTTPLAMSYYPKEGNPLWEKYSTKAVAHTLKWYSHHTFPYPYPVAISVHTDQIGMEYPMICFNGGRPEKDGTYSERVKYGMISVIIHEVGHNYFPMIVNSDERQWTWMDEGLNSFLQFLAEQQWERDYPSRRGPAANLVDYMKGDKARLEPIMTNSESLRQFGNNAYGKPATALNVLRETVMGRELFDYAFKTYSNRWMFKHPMPADFFRTMEDASGVDLDWFWRGWFYTTDNVDIAVENVKQFRIDSKNPDVELTAKKEEAKAKPRNISSVRNEKEIKQTQDEIDRNLRDFYTDDDQFGANILDKEEYQKYVASLGEAEKKLLSEGMNFYEATFEMKGELLSPIVLELNFADGSKEYHKLPCEIWRMGDKKVTKVFKTNKQLTQIVLDPYLETCDVNTENNYFPPKQQLNRFEIFKRSGNPWGGGENPMQRAKRAKEKEKQVGGGGK
ncbi:MAG: M1 family metallopeptidase [Saprospiraceae bacterium]|nr:M1 family metallopeptidase [Saprospiraceae bacterium]